MLGWLLGQSVLRQQRRDRPPDKTPVQPVGEGGLEPPHPFGHRNLNPARLPIPPLARVEATG